MNSIGYCIFFFSSRRRHTRYWRDWSSDVCSSDLRTATTTQAYGATRSRAAAGSTPGTRINRRTGSSGPITGAEDRKSVVLGKSVDLGGRRIIKKKQDVIIDESLARVLITIIWDI